MSIEIFISKVIASPYRKDNVPTQDAHVVTLLKEAGVISLGKLTMHGPTKEDGGWSGFSPGSSAGAVSAHGGNERRRIFLGSYFLDA